MNVDMVIADRFGRWGQFLRERRATPLLMIGLASDGQLVVTTCEMEDRDVVSMVEAVFLMVKAGAVEHR
jgi:hypothetical protein